MDIKDFNLQVSDLIPDSYKFSPSVGPLSGVLFNIKSNQQANQLEGWHDLDSSYVRKSIQSEIHRYLRELVRKDLMECEVIDYLYCDPKNSTHVNILLDKLEVHSPKYVRISVGMLSNSIQDSQRFDFHRINHNKFDLSPYPIGVVNGIIFEIDPYFQIDDDTIYLFENIEVNIQDVESSKGWEGHNLVDKFKFKFGFRIENPRAIAVITDNQSRHWNQWVKLNRNHKLNKIIDDKN